MSMNTPASVHQRLLSHARSEGLRFNDVLQRYAMERWLYRLAKSCHNEQFILKGALMLAVWDVPVTRSTRDIDMLARMQNDLDGIRQVISDVCRMECVDDGLIFAAETVNTKHIAEDALYEGVRADFRGYLGNARIAMQIDLGFSDVVTPFPVDLIYPTILDLPAPRLQAYNRETALAEKLEAMVKLGELNSRMKDFFDIWLLAASQSFEGSILSKAIANTFERRSTPINADAACFRESFGESSEKQKQWKAFVKRSQLTGRVPGGFADVWRVVTEFLKPMLKNPGTTKSWHPGGPWN
ncbi:MAG: nucleotidyl transferase AbiEii/AbiGii toxin family protein [Candidatus Hydrogenedens sp.]|nr:nucleotidyl transferase AbiEii/AbiGii toxin family protein [Candidatus Hydrogenedens sp.]